MNARTLALLALLLPFSAFSVLVVAEHGYFGFLELALREPWALQMLLDVCLALGLFHAYAIPDARARGITIWPWIVVSIFLGSIGALGYLVHRELAARTRAPGPLSA